MFHIIKKSKSVSLSIEYFRREKNSKKRGKWTIFCFSWLFFLLKHLFWRGLGRSIYCGNRFGRFEFQLLAFQMRFLNARDEEWKCLFYGQNYLKTLNKNFIIPKQIINLDLSNKNSSIYQRNLTHKSISYYWRHEHFL